MILSLAIKLICDDAKFSGRVASFFNLYLKKRNPTAATLINGIVTPSPIANGAALDGDVFVLCVGEVDGEDVAIL